MQVEYTTAFILLLTSVLAVPDATSTRSDTTSDNNSQSDSTVSTGAAAPTGLFDLFGDFVSGIYSRFDPKRKSIASNAEALKTGLINPTISTDIGNAQSYAISLPSGAPYSGGENTVSSVTQTSTAQTSTVQTSTTENRGSNAMNQATKKGMTSSSTAGAVMPTSGLGISLAGLAGIVGVVAIAL